MNLILEIENYVLTLIYSKFYDSPSIFSISVPLIARIAVPGVRFFIPSIGIAGFRWKDFKSPGKFACSVR